MQTVFLFVAFLLRNALVDLRQMEVAFRFLLAVISLGAYLIQLLVIPP